MLATTPLLDSYLLGLAGRLGATGWARGLWEAVSHSADLGLVWLLIAVLMTLRRRSDEKAVVLGVVAALVLSEVASDVLKLVVARPRPAWGVSAYSGVVPWAVFSFPSTHAARSFAAAVVLRRNSSRWSAVGLFGLACLIGISRVVLGLHWPSDVLGGAVLGLGTGAGVCAFLNRVLDDPKDRPGASSGS